GADIGGQRYFLTGDAGQNALRWAADYADYIGFQLQSFAFFQVPHHGSRRNVGPTILDRLLGPKKAQGSKDFSAFISAPKDDENHPRKVVMNAFTRRGGRVIVTAGSSKIFYGGFPKRDGYSSVEPEPIHEVVEGYD